jgi:hypothetical protein
VTERYVDARELAQIMGVSPFTVKRMLTAGMPSETWGMARTRRYLASDCIAWARSRSRMDPDNDQGRRLTNADPEAQRR